MPSPQKRSMLPLITPSHSGGRSAMTCRYRCGDACSQPVPNTSDNEYFGDIMAAGASRRSVLKFSGLTIAAGAAATAAFNSGSPQAAAAGKTRPGSAFTTRIEGQVPFEGIGATPASTDKMTVAKGYKWAPVISWGDPLTRKAPRFDFDNQTVEAQKEQAGYNADFVATFAFKGNKNRTVLAFNNEYTNDELMFRGVESADDLTNEQLEIIMAAHGVTIVELSRRNEESQWRYVRGARVNRRLHTHSEFTVDGPAAGSKLLQTKADPSGKKVLGTLNNCAGGVTPWGTMLTGEENFNQYFNADNAPAEIKDKLDRYGINSSGRGWERADDRFDVGNEPNECNRFGWIVEVDPHDPKSTPVKHTALGRFKHEGGTVAETKDGRVAVYMGDDERFDYMYKFLSKNKIDKGEGAAAKKHNMTLLSEGDLYVAKFKGNGLDDGISDGTGEWIPLIVDGKSKVDGMSVEEVLVYTRLAGDKAGATKMDRPEDVEPNPVNGKVYAALTNNTKRTPSQIDEANPRANNKHGHVLELSPKGNDHGELTFEWNLILICGNPDDPTTYFGGYDKSDVSEISCPDNVAFDEQGNLWISTDGQPGTLEINDSLYCVPVSGDQRGRVQRFLSVPCGAETCGPWIDPSAEKSVFVAVQHPGEVDGATPDNVKSNYPYQGDGQPRPGVAHIYGG